MYLTIIAAATMSNGIGNHGHMPWSLPSESHYFDEVTMECPDGYRNAAIMGRSTWETFTRPLDMRSNLVLTRNPGYDLGPFVKSAPAYVFNNLNSAIEHLQEDDEDKPIYRAFVIGGAWPFRESLSLSLEKDGAVVDRVLLTRIFSPDYECDVFMPRLKRKDGWAQADHSELEAWLGFRVPRGIQRENGAKYEYQMWVRDV